MSIKLLYSCFVSFFDLYKEYNNCLIPFLSFSELFPAFNWAKVIGNLLSIWSGVKSFNLCPGCFWIFSLKLRISLTIFNILFGCFLFFFHLQTFFQFPLLRYSIWPWLVLQTHCFSFYLLFQISFLQKSRYYKIKIFFKQIMVKTFWLILNIIKKFVFFWFFFLFCFKCIIFLWKYSFLKKINNFVSHIKHFSCRFFCFFCTSWIIVII